MGEMLGAALFPNRERKRPVVGGFSKSYVPNRKMVVL
jgi:hypothetical protein